MLARILRLRVPTATAAPWTGLESAPLALWARDMPSAIRTRIRIATRAPTPVASALVAQRPPFGDMSAPVAFGAHDLSAVVALRAWHLATPITQLALLSFFHSSTPTQNPLRLADCGADRLSPVVSRKPAPADPFLTWGSSSCTRFAACP